MFRKLYWVTEQVSDGNSRVTGVYTSLPNLVAEGLSRNDPSSLRLTLTLLDSEDEPLGTFEGPDFAGLSSTLLTYSQSGDWSLDQCEALMEKLNLGPIRPTN
jgi:hypothetical protein